MKIRIDRGRNNYEEFSAANYATRTYVTKPKGGEVNEDEIKKQVRILHTIYLDYFGTRNLSTTPIILRVAYYWNPQDPYYSVILCWKVSPSDKAKMPKIADIRYTLQSQPLLLYKIENRIYGLICYISNYEIEKAAGIFDSDHADDGVEDDFTEKRLNRFLGLTEEEPKTGRRNKKNKKDNNSPPDPSKESDDETKDPPDPNAQHDDQNDDLDLEAEGSQKPKKEGN